MVDCDGCGVYALAVMFMVDVRCVLVAMRCAPPLIILQGAFSIPANKYVEVDFLSPIEEGN
jgi:hypothetical protein